MENTELVVIKPEEYGISQEQVKDIVGNLPQLKEERAILSEQYSKIILLDLEDLETPKKARELRLLIKDNRTKGLEVWHKTTKEFFLKGGQFIDAIKRKEIAENIRMEENLESIEKHAENKEKERKKKLNEERLSQLEQYNAFVPIGLNFGEISEEEYHKIFNGAKLQYEAQLKEEQEAEFERQRLAEIENLHVIRKDTILSLSLWQFVEDTELNFGELSEDEFSTLKENAEIKKVEFQAEQAKLKAENERLAEEKRLLEEKITKEKKETEAKEAKLNDRRKKLQPYLQYIRDYERVINLSDSDFEKELNSLNSQVMEQMKFEAEERMKQENTQRELQERKDAEVIAEKARIEAENKAKKEAEKLAKAPMKKQMSIWVNSFEIPTTEISNEKVELIKTKFEAFKKWSQEQIEKL